MILHNDKKLFSDTIRAAAQTLKINELSAMAYTTIPDEAEVAISFRKLIKLIQ